MLFLRRYYPDQVQGVGCEPSQHKAPPAFWWFSLYLPPHSIPQPYRNVKYFILKSQIKKAQRLCFPLGKQPLRFLWDVPERIRTAGLSLRSMAYHVIHGSDVTSNIIPYTEWLVVNELYGAKHLFWRSFMRPLGGPISKFLARGHPAKVDCYCHSSFP